nr:14904_t:CDS:10 [Entrophospora candida]CAG8570577.1 11818_t:CDS:10 [Entrophospora candida]
MSKFTTFNFPVSPYGNLDFFQIEESLGKFVTVKLENDEVFEGYLYNIDPVTFSVFLLKINKEDLLESSIPSKHKVLVVMHHAISDFQVNEKENRLSKEVLDSIVTTRTDDYDVNSELIQKRKEALINLFESQRLQITYDKDDPIIHVMNRANVLPPYVTSSIEYYLIDHQLKMESNSNDLKSAAASLETKISTPYRKNKVYENCKVYSETGELMFRCNRKKCLWYLTRNLAKQLSSDSIQLTFTPKGLGYAQKKQNDKLDRCVCCAQTEKLTLHHVVPDMYRKRMPEVIKSHSSHDVVLLCFGCHSSYEKHVTQYKKQIVKEFNAPPLEVDSKDRIRLEENIKVKKAANTLLKRLKAISHQTETSTNANFLTKRFSFIPKERVEQLEQIVLDWYYDQNQNNNTSALINQKKYYYVSMNDDGKEEEIIFDETKHDDDDIESKKRIRWSRIEIFIKNWRQHFLDYANPKYLSKNWKVNNKIYNFL